LDVGAEKPRHPDEDLPADSEAHREHYAALRRPLDPTPSSMRCMGQLLAGLEALTAAVPKPPCLQIADRRKAGAIKLTDCVIFFGNGSVFRSWGLAHR
jgi:hypothetical protein